MDNGRPAGSYTTAGDYHQQITFRQMFRLTKPRASVATHYIVPLTGSAQLASRTEVGLSAVSSIETPSDPDPVIRVVGL